MADERPSVLIIGGCGFIGKHLVKYLIDYQIASVVRVVDKRLPKMAYMDPDFTAAFEQVDFQQVDVAQAPEKAWGGHRYSIVVNLASAMEFGKPSQWYELNILQARQKCAATAAEMTCDKYLEVSTTGVYKPADDLGKKPSDESAACEPKNIIAAKHYEAEQWILQNCPSLPVIIARLPTVYGPADMHGLMPRLICAASYLVAGDGGTPGPMQMLYSDDLRMHTVHVQDAVGCLWFLLCSGTDREIYNVCDDNDTTQKKFNSILQEVFGLKCSCVGKMTTQIALKAADLGELVGDANEEHAENWMKLCVKFGADPNGPLITMVDPEELKGRANSVCNAKSKAVGYQYSVPNVTAEYVRHALQYWTDLNGKKFFPASVIKA